MNQFLRNVVFTTISTAKSFALPLLVVVAATLALAFPLEDSKHCGGVIRIGHAPAGGPYVPRDLRTEAAILFATLCVATILAFVGQPSNSITLGVCGINWMFATSALSSISKETCPGDAKLDLGFWAAHICIVISNWALAVKEI